MKASGLNSQLSFGARFRTAGLSFPGCFNDIARGFKRDAFINDQKELVVPKIGEVDSDDPDNVDNTNAPMQRSQYEPTDAPFQSNVADRRAAEDEAASNDQLRHQYARAPIRSRQAREPIQDAADINQQDVPADADGGNYIALVLRDAARPDTVQERGNGGVEAQGAPGAANYDRIGPAEYNQMVHAAHDMIEKLQAEAAAAKKAQDTLAAKAALNRKFAIANAIVGGLTMATTLAAILAAYFLRPRDDQGPSAFNLDGGASLDPAQKTIVDVAGQTLSGSSGDAIDKSSIQLVSHDAGTTAKLTLADIGIWTVPGDGTVVFTPDSKFKGGSVNVLYTIADTAGHRSARAQINLRYHLKSLPGTGGPAVKNFEQTHIANETVVIKVASAATPGPSGAAVDPASVALPEADKATPKTLFQVGLGTWTLSAAGDITFTPIIGFLGGDVRIRYTIADVNGNTSNSGEISLTFYRRARIPDIVHQVSSFVAGTAIGVNVVDGTSDFGKPITDPALSIDPASVILTGVVKSETEEVGPDATAKAGLKRLEVTDEGVWEVADQTGKITFTPDPALTDDPHPISYQVADTKGVYSTIGQLTFSTTASAIFKSLGAINAKTDAVFWSDYETQVIKANLGTDRIGQLLLLRSVTTDLWMNTLDGLNTTDRDAVASRRDELLRGVLGLDYKVWRSGAATDPEPPLSPAKLFTMSKAYDDAKVGIPTIRLSTRYVRLTYIQQMLAFYAGYIKNGN